MSIAFRGVVSRLLTARLLDVFVITMAFHVVFGFLLNGSPSYFFCDFHVVPWCAWLLANGSHSLFSVISRAFHWCFWLLAKGSPS